MSMMELADAKCGRSHIFGDKTSYFFTYPISTSIQYFWVRHVVREWHDGGNLSILGHKRKKRGLGRPARSMAKTSFTLQSVVHNRQKRQKQPSPLKWVKYRIFLSLSVRSLCILGVTVSFCNYSSQNFSPTDVSAEVDQIRNRWGWGFW